MDAVGGPNGQLVCQRQGQSGLARPPGTSERDQSRATVEQRANCRQIPFPSDRGSEHARQVTRSTTATQRRELLAQPLGPGLEQPEFPGDVLERVLTEIDE